MNNGPILEDLFSFTRILLSKSSNFRQLLVEELKQKWKEELSQVPNCYDYHLTSSGHYNLFKIILLASHFQGGLRLPRVVQGYHMFKRLDAYLNLFPYLLESPSFWNQLVTLHGDYFMLLLSQLTLATYFRQRGFEIRFDGIASTLFTEGSIRIYDAGSNSTEFQICRIVDQSLLQAGLSQTLNPTISSVDLTYLIDNNDFYNLKNQTILIVVPSIFNHLLSQKGAYYNCSTYVKLVNNHCLLLDKPGVVFIQDTFTDANVFTAMCRLSIHLVFDPARIHLPLLGK